MVYGFGVDLGTVPPEHVRGPLDWSKEYRVIVEPISTSNPEGSTVALFLRHEVGWVRIGDDIVAGPGERDAELLERAWEHAEYHSKVTSDVRE